MMEFIRPNTKFEFMGNRNIWLTVSGVLVFLSLAAWAFMGLNLGIDFKGGTKIILAFKGTDVVNRDKLRDITGAVFTKAGEKAPEVQVQDFMAGGTQAEDAVRYVLYTDLVSVLPEAQKTAIVDDFKKTFPGIVVNPPSEGGDQFYIAFADEAPIIDRYKAIEELMGRHKLLKVSVEAERIRDMQLENVREMNLLAAESGDADGNIDAILAKQEFEQKLAEFTSANNDRNFTVRIEAVKLAIENGIKADAELGPRFLAVESATSVSPSVGADMLNEGLLAVLYSLIGMLIYIALRFDFRYGPGAVIALFHDSIITIGVFAIFQIPFSMTIIAAILTIVGYSVNDTIVVFDRIRENVSKFRDKPLDRIVNQAVNETLSRTILTSATTLFTVIAIFVLGGGLIKDFALALLVGITIGTYSSVFIASPVMMWFDKLLKPKGA